MSTFDATRLSTSDLWRLTNAALLSGKASDARAGLDELARRPDHTDCFAAPESYTRLLPAAFRPLIADRVALANSRAEQNGYMRRVRMSADSDFGSGVPAGWEYAE